MRCPYHDRKATLKDVVQYQLNGKTVDIEFEAEGYTRATFWEPATYWDPEDYEVEIDISNIDFSVIDNEEDGDIFESLPSDTQKEIIDFVYDFVESVCSEDWSY